MSRANDSELSNVFCLGRVRGGFLALWLAGLVALGVLAPERGRADGTRQIAPILFDIGPQSLETALDEFGSTSNVQVLYEASLTWGRRSARVHGLFTPGAALNALLAGTGLTAWHTTEDSYSLVRQQEATSASGENISPLPPEITRYSHFLGGVQAGFLNALCRNPQTRPGQYRISLKFRIAPSGQIQQTTLVESTGDSERDAEIIAAVEHFTAGGAPPLDLTQPITLVISPGSPDVTGDCASVAGIGANR